jgi:hypothetical protein
MLLNETSSNHLYQRIWEAHQLPRTSAIREFRVILENLYKLLSVTENRAFNGLASRAHFIYDRFQLPNQLKYQGEELRKFCNKEAHEDFKITDRDYFSALKV